MFSRTTDTEAEVIILFLSLSQVRTVQLVLEEEGSSTSPATISKVPGTSYSPSTSSSSSSAAAAAAAASSSSSTSSKSITEIGGHGSSDLFGGGGGGGGGFEAHSQPSTSHVSSKTVSCTRSTRRTIVHTKDGPVERVEQVMEGGPECQTMTDLSKGGMSSFFPSLSHASTASSSSSSFSSGTKTVQLGGTKGISDPFNTDVGFDLGAFMTDRAEDDLPDFHARSVKSTRVERQADYIGKGTETSGQE